VLITDMRMPGIDGVALLTIARDEHPSVVRIVLSGHTDIEAAVRSVPLAHRFLSKPCDPATLLETVTNACDLEHRLNSDRLRAILGRVDSLPSAPQSTIALNQLLGSDEVSIEPVADVVVDDAAMTAKLLQLVNSAFFGLARPVTSVRDAVAYLGINVVRNLTAALEAVSLFEHPELTDRAFIESHHAHSQEVATVARELSPPAVAMEAFGIALMHDIGALVIARCMPDDLREIDAAVTVGLHRTAAELDILGATHADIGAYLLALWGLPYVIVESIAAHHRQPALDAADAVHATFLAEALVQEAGCARGTWPEDGSIIDEDYVSALGLEEAVARMRARLGTMAGAR
jgi:HD-like signal output (HDOD) protein